MKTIKYAHIYKIRTIMSSWTKDREFVGVCKLKDIQSVLKYLKENDDYHTKTYPNLLKQLQVMENKLKSMRNKKRESVYEFMEQFNIEQQKLVNGLLKIQTLEIDKEIHEYELKVNKFREEIKKRNDNEVNYDYAPITKYIPD